MAASVFLSPLTAGPNTWNGSQVPAAANTYDLGSAALPWRDVYAQAVSLGSNAATAGAVRLGNSQGIRGRNAANTADIEILGTTSGNFIELAGNGASVRTGGTIYPASALNLGSASNPWGTVYLTAVDVGGAPGIDFNGAVTNLTVVKGIVTAAS